MEKKFIIYNIADNSFFNKYFYYITLKIFLMFLLLINEILSKQYKKFYQNLFIF